MWMSTSTGIPTSTTTSIAASTRGKVRARANGSMMPATGAESHTRTRELPRSTIKEQAAKVRSPGSLTKERWPGCRRGFNATGRRPTGGADRGGQAGPSTTDRGGQQNAFAGADKGSNAKMESNRGQASRESMSAQSSQRGGGSSGEKRWWKKAVGFRWWWRWRPQWRWRWWKKIRRREYEYTHTEKRQVAIDDYLLCRFCGSDHGVVNPVTKLRSTGQSRRPLRLPRRL